jgi:hypothetical protein
MAHYTATANPKEKSYTLTITLSDEEVTDYIKRYGNAAADAMEEENATARTDLVFAVFRALAEDDLHEQMKYMCQEESN